uniref:adenine phosphoribosyltransferase n=1 Tax=Cairina moschata TaxID=8855 RepID=A0A8C3CAF4_CAIMO
MQPPAEWSFSWGLCSAGAGSSQQSCQRLVTPRRLPFAKAHLQSGRGAWPVQPALDRAGRCPRPQRGPPPLSPQALQDCVADLLQPFQGDPIDLVAGIDAMGFILGAAVAAALRKGFLAIRKAGHLCVETLSEPYTDYSGREKVMEVRTDTVSPGLRVLLVDQWVETGGTMRAAIRLVERLGGVVAGRRGHPGVLSASTLLSKVSAATRKKKSRTFSPAPWD